VSRLIGVLDTGNAKAISTGMRGASAPVESAQQRSGMDSGTD